MVLLLTASEDSAAPSVKVEPFQFSEVPSRARGVGVALGVQAAARNGRAGLAMPVTLSSAARLTLMGAHPGELMV